MSDYHILKQTLDKKRVTVAFHFTVPPASENEAAVLYTTIAAKIEDHTSAVPNHETDFATEYSDMQAGSVIERVEAVQLSSINLTPVQKRDEIAARHATLQTETFDKLAVEWEWYDYNADVT